MNGMSYEKAMGKQIVNNTNYNIINPETRTITVAEKYKLLGIESDEKSKGVLFRCPKIVDKIDLSTMNIYVNYQNANGEKNAHLVDNVIVDGDYIVFEWIMNRRVFMFKGMVTYIVCAKKSDDTGILNEWNTKIAYGFVEEGLEASQEIEERDHDVLEQLLLKIDNIDNRLDNLTIPTKTSQLENDSGYLTEHQDISGKVDKIEGKGLSTNDYTDEDKELLHSLDPSAVGKIDAIEVNGVEQEIVDKTVNISIPTKTSQLENDSNFLTEHQDISGKVDKIEGKMLSTNDYTNEDKERLHSLDPSVFGKINTIKVNDIEQEIVDKTVNISIPTKTSQLENDSGYLTEHQDISGKQDKLIPGDNIEIDGNVISSPVSEINIDEKTITKNNSDEIQSVGIIEQNNGAVNKTWIGTKDEYNSISELDDNTFYYITDDESDSKGKVVEIGSYQYSYGSTILPAIPVDILRQVYIDDKAGVPQVLHWTLYGVENNLKIVSSDLIAGTYSIDVLVHNKHHCEYKWTISTAGIVNPNVGGDGSGSDYQLLIDWTAQNEVVSVSFDQGDNREDFNDYREICIMMLVNKLETPPTSNVNIVYANSETALTAGQLWQTSRANIGSTIKSNEFQGYSISKFEKTNIGTHRTLIAASYNFASVLQDLQNKVLTGFNAYNKDGTRAVGGVDTNDLGIIKSSLSDSWNVINIGSYIPCFGIGSQIKIYGRK